MVLKKSLQTIKILHLILIYKTSIIKLIEYKEKKFRITYDNRNGIPLGFDYMFKTEILKEDVWVTIAGKNDISFKEISYVSDKV